jgi:6-phosphofructokinase
MVLGHLQRGGGPTNFDRALCTLFGTTAVELIAEERFGRMVTYTGSGIDSVSIADAVGQLRRVTLDGAFVRGARALGISLGD